MCAWTAGDARRCRMWLAHSLHHGETSPSVQGFHVLRGPHALTVSSSPEPCSIPLPAEVQFRHLCPQGEKLPRQSHQTPSSLSKGAGRKEIPFPISGTHFPKQGHPTGPVHFPDGLIENLVGVTDLCASMSHFPLLSNGVVSGC